MRLRFEVLTLCLAAACARSDASRSDAQAAVASVVDTARPWRKPGDKIDSILPMPEYLRRFRKGLAEPARLEGGAASRKELAERFLAAVSARDTAALAALAVSRAEFAWLIFPSHRYYDPPYELDPEIFWMQLTSANASGLHRLLERYGGTRLAFIDLHCQPDTLQVKPGPIKLSSACRMRYRAGGVLESRVLFGSVVKRDGRLKLLSLANDF